MQIRIACHHCHYNWCYRGNSNGYATCPKCHYKCSIKKDHVSDTTHSYLPTHNDKANKKNDYEDVSNEYEYSLTHNEDFDIEDIIKRISDLEKRITNIENNNITNIEHKDAEYSNSKISKKGIVKNEYSNVQGRSVICPKCHHQWITHSTMAVIRCSNCNARIHIND